MKPVRKDAWAPAKEWMVWAGSPTTQRSSDVAAPQVEQRLLERADVLVLVDHEVAVGAAHLGGDVGVLGEQAGGAQQDVVEVDDAAGRLDRLVVGQEPADLVGREAVHLPAAAGARAAYSPGATLLTLAQLISPATSRSSPVSGASRSRRSASATRPRRLSATGGRSLP